MTEMKDIKKKDTEGLRALSRELRETLRTFRFGGAGARRRDVKEGRTLRRDIARIETELSARKLAEAGK